MKKAVAVIAVAAIVVLAVAAALQAVWKKEAITEVVAKAKDELAE